MKEEKKENPIHLRFEYGEALEAKREILYVQKNLMEMNKAMREYFSLNNEGVMAKIALHRRLKEAVNFIKKIQKEFPEVKMPDILKKEGDEKEISKAKKDSKSPLKIKKQVYDNSIESQLQEIQEKLNRLNS